MPAMNYAKAYAAGWRSRKSDYHPNSQAAWEQHLPNAGTLDAHIIRVLNAAGPEGLISHEVAERLNRPIQSVTGNMRHLKRRGLVLETDRTRLTPSRRKAQVLVVAWHAERPPAAPAAPAAPRYAVQDDMTAIQCRDVTITDEQQRLDEIAEIIREGDRRLLHRDGPISGFPPEIKLSEWKRMYALATGEEQYEDGNGNQDN